MIRFQDYKVYGLISVLALASWWLTQWQFEPKPILVSSENSPDLISHGYYKMTMDKDGLPKSELLANEMRHYPKDGSNQFTQPVMTLFKPDQAPWVLHAETAVMEKDGDTLHMNGKSVIEREESANNKALTVYSADLLVKLSTHFAESKAFTELFSPPHKTTGTGVEVTFSSPIHLKLLSTVKGYYELKKNHNH